MTVAQNYPRNQTNFGTMLSISFIVVSRAVQFLTPSCWSDRDFPGGHSMHGATLRTQALCISIWWHKNSFKTLEEAEFGPFGIQGRFSIVHARLTSYSKTCRAGLSCLLVEGPAKGESFLLLVGNKPLEISARLVTKSMFLGPTAISSLPSDPMWCHESCQSLVLRRPFFLELTGSHWLVAVLVEWHERMGAIWREENSWML